MADQVNDGWTLFLDSDRIQEGADVIKRWWSGEADLRVADHAGTLRTWRGARYPDGSMLMEVGAVKFTGGAQGRKATFRLAVMDDSLRRAVQIDMGAVRYELGWVYLDSAGVWQRVPRTYRGRGGKASVQNGQLIVEVAIRRQDIDRGVPLYWSHETAAAGDTYARKARELESGFTTRWPPFVPRAVKRKRFLGIF